MPSKARKTSGSRATRAARDAVLGINNPGKRRNNIRRRTDADGFSQIEIQTAIRNSLLEQNPPQQEPRPNGLSKARKSSSRRVSKMARRAVLSTRKEEQGSMKTDPNQFDDDAIECAIRISLMEQKKEKEKK